MRSTPIAPKVSILMCESSWALTPATQTQFLHDVG